MTQNWETRVDTLEGHAVTQMDLRQTTETDYRNGLTWFPWSSTRRAEFSTWGRTAPEPATCWEQPAGKQLCRNGLRAPGEHSDEQSQQFTLAARETNSVVSCVQQSTASRLREVILPLHSALMKTPLECLVWYIFLMRKAWKRRGSGGNSSMSTNSWVETAKRIEPCSFQ